MNSRKLGLLGRIAGLFGLCGVLFVVDPAYGQTSSGVTNPDTAATSDTSLQEVVVTAERRAQDVQSTPIVVQALSGQQVLENHITSTNDLQLVVPGFTDNIISGGQIQNTEIRGIGQTSDQSPLVPPGIAEYRDGLLLGESAGLDVPYFDISDIEVLEGPQGTLGGGSSVGGAVEVNSANPNFRGLNGYVDLQGGNYEERKIDGAVNLQVNDTLAFRLAFNQENRGSFYRFAGEPALVNSPSASENGVVDPGSVANSDMRLSMLWKPTDNFQALFKYEYNLMNNGGLTGEPATAEYTPLFSGASCSNAGPNGSIICPGAGVPVHKPFYYAGEQPFVLNYSTPDGTALEWETHEIKYNLELRYTLPGDVVLRSLSGFQVLDQDFVSWNSNSPANDGISNRELGPWDNYYSEEINLISPTTGRINWIAGAFWFYRNTPVVLNTEIVEPPYAQTELPSYTDAIAEGQTLRTASVFGNVNWQITNSLQLQVGIRENWDNSYLWTSPEAGLYKYPYAPPDTLPGTPVGLPCTTGGSKIACNIYAGQFADSVPTGKVDLSWTPVPGQNVYAFYARGYKGGGPNANPNSVNPDFLPETINDWELGWKGKLLNNHIVMQVGGYYMDYQHMVYPIYNIYAPSTGLGDAINLPPSTIDGLEVSEQSRFGHLDFNLGVSYNHTVLGSLTTLDSGLLPGGTAYNFGAASAPTQCPASGPIPGCFNYLPYEQTLTGENSALSPVWTGNVVIDYGFQIGNNTLRPRLKLAYVDSQYASLFEIPFYYIPSRTLLDANLDYEAGNWLWSLYGTNVTNKLYVSSNDGTNIYYGNPRQWGVRMQYTFAGSGN